ncbi:hypothetical protein Nepgr_026640 [Nepenthes gracilis]|uniref:Uncharacterized protein n=1 Tax=Nepenthes gracilis TaxID=150966 RepID=A0AAD3TA47_NEPGR|nr:hypothetical protein Nepgr_026640 [Nepenthes gracilis]
MAASSVNDSIAGPLPWSLASPEVQIPVIVQAAGDPGPKFFLRRSRLLCRTAIVRSSFGVKFFWSEIRRSTFCRSAFVWSFLGRSGHARISGVTNFRSAAFGPEWPGASCGGSGKLPECCF